MVDDSADIQGTEEGGAAAAAKAATACTIILACTSGLGYTEGGRNLLNPMAKAIAERCSGTDMKHIARGLGADGRKVPDGSNYYVAYHIISVFSEAIWDEIVAIVHPQHSFVVEQTSNEAMT